MFKQAIVLSAAVGLSISLIGCTQPSSPAPARKGPNVVVVDLVAVARAVGRENAARANMERATTQLNQRLEQIRQNMAQQIEDKKAEFGVDAENYTDEQKRVLVAMNNEALGKMRQAQGQAQLVLRQLQVQINLRFRDDVKPIAEEIALDLGADAALITDPTSLLWYDAEADITDEVIAVMRKRAAEQPAVPTPPASNGASDSGSGDSGSPSSEPAGDG